MFSWIIFTILNSPESSDLIIYFKYLIIPTSEYDVAMPTGVGKGEINQTQTNTYPVELPQGLKSEACPNKIPSIIQSYFTLSLVGNNQNNI